MILESNLLSLIIASCVLDRVSFFAFLLVFMLVRWRLQAMGVQVFVLDSNDLLDSFREEYLQDFEHRVSHLLVLSYHAAPADPKHGCGSSCRIQCHIERASDPVRCPCLMPFIGNGISNTNC